MKRSILLLLSALLSGCQMTNPKASMGDPQVGGLKSHSAEWRGLKLARNRCSDCHAVEYGDPSPTPKAPSFVAVANKPGLTRASLNRWLRTHGSHPQEMYFEIPAEHIDDLVAYMLTLRQSGRTKDLTR